MNSFMLTIHQAAAAAQIYWYALPQTYQCAAVLVLTGGLAAAAGIGGGGIIVAVLMFCGDMAPHDAVPMSKAVVFMGVVVSSFMNVKKRGPQGQALVDFDIVASVVPMALAGTLLGVWLNSRVPPEGIVLILIGTFALMLATTGQKLAEQIQEEQAAETATRGMGPPVHIRHDGRSDDPNDPMEIARRRIIQDKQELAARADRRNIALVWTLAALLASVIFGGVLHKSLLDCHIQIRDHNAELCESVFLKYLFTNPHFLLRGPHGLTIAAFPLIASCVCCILCFVMVYLGFMSRRSPLSPKPSIKYSLMAFITGILAGMVGIGGGLIFSPFMVWYGVNPHVAVATSTFCVIFTSTSTTLQYSLMGRIHIPLALVYGVANQVSSYVGTVFIHGIQDRYPLKKSYPTTIVFIAVAMSAVLTLAKLHSMTQAKLHGEEHARSSEFRLVHLHHHPS